MPETPPLLLVVDDAPDVLHISELLCRRSGYAFRGCRDAKEAGDYLSEPTEPVPDLLLLDANLPGESGLSLHARLSRLRELQPMKTALLSQRSLSPNVATAIRSGILFLFAKELLSQPAEWKARVEEILATPREAPEEPSGNDPPSTWEELRDHLEKVEIHPLTREMGPEPFAALAEMAFKKVLAEQEPPRTMGKSEWASGMKPPEELTYFLRSDPVLRDTFFCQLNHQLRCLLGPLGETLMGRRSTSSTSFD